MKNISTNRARCVRLMLSEPVLAQYRRLEASRKAVILLHRTVHMVSYRRIAMVIKMAGKVVIFFIVVCLPDALVATGSIWSE